MFREGNQLTDFFTNLIFSFVGTDKLRFRSIHEISNKAKSIINLERCSIPNVRVKNIKIEGQMCTEGSMTTISTTFINNK